VCCVLCELCESIFLFLQIPYMSLSFEFTADGTGERYCARGRRSSRCQRAPLRAEYPHSPCVPQAKKIRMRRHARDERVNAKGRRKRPWKRSERTLRS